jgi:hypothetical protein
MRSQIEREAVCAFAVVASFTTTGRCSETGSGGTADCAAAVDVFGAVAGSPVVPDPAVGGCWSDEVDPAAAAAAGS